MSRKRTPTKTSDETNVLRSSARRCALCFGINGDFSEKSGQIAHVDQNSANSSFNNLAWLCLDHHDRYDGKTSQSKGITRPELLAYRQDLYRHVESIRHDLLSEQVDFNILGEAQPKPSDEIVSISAPEYNHHIIEQWQAYREGLTVPREQSQDRVTALNRENVTVIGSQFDEKNNYSELSGKIVDWEVLVINVSRVKAHDGEFIVVMSQLTSGGAELEWYFKASLHEQKLRKLDCLDLMRARGLVSSGGFIADAEILSVKKMSMQQVEQLYK